MLYCLYNGQTGRNTYPRRLPATSTLRRNEVLSLLPQIQISDHVTMAVPSENADSLLLLTLLLCDCRCHTTVIPQMRTRPPKQTLPYKSLTQQQLNILLRPAPSRQRLEEHHDFLSLHQLLNLFLLNSSNTTHLKIHLNQLISPLHQKRCTDIKMKLRKPLLLRHIRIPHPNRALDIHLPHQ